MFSDFHLISISQIVLNVHACCISERVATGKTNSQIMKNISIVISTIICVVICLANNFTAVAVDTTMYIVKEGDSFYSIADMYNLEVAELVKSNGKKLDDVLLAGEKLKVPINGVQNTTQSNIHIVENGESWSSIASLYGISISALLQQNKHTINETIYPGEKLEIPTKKTNTTLLASKTLYNVPNGNSWYNIQKSANAINGIVLDSGETFSWFLYVGACGENDGYLSADAYNENGEKVKDYGGGICFTSTTLMQTAREAGMQIIEKHDHSKPVAYAKRGDEASINFNNWDLKFVNKTGYTVKFIATTNSSGALTITCSVV